MPSPARTRLVSTLVLLPLTAGVSACSMGSQAAKPSSAVSSASTASASASASTSAPSTSAPSTTPTAATPTSDPSLPKAKDAFSKVQDRINTYHSLTYSGKGEIDGAEGTTFVKGDLDGEPQQATIDTKGQGSLEIRRIRNDVYARGNIAYWRSIAKPGTDPTQLADRWFKASKEQFDSRDLAALTIDDLLADVTNDDRRQSKMLLSDDAQITRDSVNGTAAYRLTTTDGKTQVWTTVYGKFDLLKLAGLPRAVGYEEIVFSDWNKTFSIETPRGATTLKGRAKGASSSSSPTRGATS